MYGFTKLFLFVFTLLNPEIGFKLTIGTFGPHPTPQNLFTKYIRNEDAEKPSNHRTEDSVATVDFDALRNIATASLPEQIEEILISNSEPSSKLLNILVKLLDPASVDLSSNCCVEKYKQVIELITQNYNGYEKNIRTCDSIFWREKNVNAVTNKYKHWKNGQLKPTQERLFRPLFARKDDESFTKLSPVDFCKKNAVSKFTEFIELFVQVKSILTHCSKSYKECDKGITAVESFLKWNEIYNTINKVNKSTLVNVLINLLISDEVRPDFIRIIGKIVDLETADKLESMFDQL